MDIKNFLVGVCKEIKYEPVRKPISEELESHIQEMKESYVNNDGLAEDEAEERAVKQMGIPEEIGKKLNNIHKPKLDWKLLSLVFILAIYGLYIAICKQEMGNVLIGNTIVYMICGLILGGIIYFFDYRKIKKYSNLIYVIAILIIVLALIPGFGVQINGVRSYMRIGKINVNTCTISVPLFIIAFVGFLTNYNSENIKKINIEIIEGSVTFNKDLLKIILCSLLSLILIIQIPSIANAFILGMVYLISTTIYVIKKSEHKKRILFIMYGSLTLLAVILIGMGGWRIMRFASSFKPELDPQGSGYTGMLQKEILENAKLIGEADTDIITTDEYIISRESNFTFIYLVGKAGIIVAFILVTVVILTSIKLILNAKLIKDMYGKILIIGLSSLFILQSMASILMNVNLGIQTNVNLPFVSRGGVYFIINCVCIALILSVYRRKDIDFI